MILLTMPLIGIVMVTMMMSSKVVKMMENIREDLSQDIDCGGDGSVEPDCKVKIPPKLDDLLTKKILLSHRI